MNRKTASTFLGVVVAVFGFAPCPAQVEQVPTSPPAAVGEPVDDYDRFSLRAGAFVLSGLKTTLRLDVAGEQVGDEIDLVDDLGGSDSLSLFRVDAEWRFARRHRIGVSWFDIQQSITHELAGEIEWGDETYPVDTVVKTDFGVTVSKINYGYTFFTRGSHEVTGLVGFHVTRLEAAISVPDVGRSEGVGVTAPLPVIGLEWRARVSDRLTSQVSYEYFGISIDDRYSGSLSDILVFLDYSLNEHWSVGLGFNRYILRAAVESENLKLTLKHSYNGLIASVGARF